MVSRARMLGIWLLCVLVSAVALVWMLLAAVAGSARAWKLAVAHDQLANTAFGGDEDETISSRAAKAARRRERWACVLCKFLDKLDPGHCEKNIELDEGKRL